MTQNIRHALCRIFFKVEDTSFKEKYKYVSFLLSLEAVVEIKKEAFKLKPE